MAMKVSNSIIWKGTTVQQNTPQHRQWDDSGEPELLRVALTHVPTGVGRLFYLPPGGRLTQGGLPRQCQALGGRVSLQEGGGPLHLAGPCPSLLGVGRTPRSYGFSPWPGHYTRMSLEARVCQASRWRGAGRGISGSGDTVDKSTRDKSFSEEQEVGYRGKASLSQHMGSAAWDKVAGEEQPLLPARVTGRDAGD